MGLFGKAKPSGPDPQISRLSRNLDEAELRFLEVLRREVANMIVAKDPDAMLRAYRRAWSWEGEIGGNPELSRAEETALITRIPWFKDFDVVGTRHFIPYVEARSMVSDERLVEHYHDLSKMIVFLKNRNESEVVRSRPVHDEKEAGILLDSMRREKDRRFKVRIEDALSRCHAYRRGIDVGKGDDWAGLYERYSDAEVEVFQIPYGTNPENQTGIVFKTSEEFGIYGFFVDDARNKTYHGYYRTDASFKDRRSLVT